MRRALEMDEGTICLKEDRYIFEESLIQRPQGLEINRHIFFNL